MILAREYLDETGRSPFSEWFHALDHRAALKVATALERIALGHTSAMKGLGDGVSEYKIDFGPGYRIYFGKDGDTLVILLAGGSKDRQQRDIAAAKQRWKQYKQTRK